MFWASVLILSLYMCKAQKDTELKTFIGEFKGQCEGDGLYYMDEHSFIMCNSKNYYIQPCPPGTMNRPYDGYDSGNKYAFESFCEINLVNFGYTEKQQETANKEKQDKLLNDNKEDSYDDNRESQYRDRHEKIIDHGDDYKDARPGYSDPREKLEDDRFEIQNRRPPMVSAHGTEHENQYGENKRPGVDEDLPHRDNYPPRRDESKRSEDIPYRHDDPEIRDNPERFSPERPLHKDPYSNRVHDRERLANRIRRPFPDNRSPRKDEPFGRGRHEINDEKNDLKRNDNFRSEPYQRPENNHESVRYMDRPDPRVFEDHRPYEQNKFHPKEDRFVPRHRSEHSEAVPPYLARYYEREGPSREMTDVLDQNQPIDVPPYAVDHPRPTPERFEPPFLKPADHGRPQKRTEFERDLPFIREGNPYQSHAENPNEIHPKSFESLPPQRTKDDGYIYMVISMPKKMVIGKDSERLSPKDLESDVKIIGFHGKDGKYTPLAKPM